MRRWLLLIFLTTIAIDWPQRLAFNIRLADAAFVAAAVAIVASARSWSWPRWHALDVAVLVYLTGSLIAVVASPDPRAGVVEMVRHLYVAAIYIVIALAVRQGLTPTIGTGLALSGGALALLGLVAGAVRITTGAGITALTPLTALPYIGDTVRLRALAASEAMLACVLAVSLPFALLHPAVRASRARTIIAAMVFGAASALTFSHSIAGIAVAALIVVWPHLKAVPARIAAAGAALLVVLAFNFAASVAIRSIGTTPFRDDTVFQYGVDRGRAEIGGVNIEYQTMSYLRIKQVAWDAFLSRPLVGIGLDRFHAITETAFQNGRLTANYRTIDPHSTFIGRLAETGVIGLITLLVLWAAIARTVLQQRLTGDWIATAIIAAIAATLVNTMNADVMNFRFLWVVLGLVRGRAHAQISASR